MKTTSKAVRALFFVVVFLGYTQTTGAMNLQFGCDPPWCINAFHQATRCYYADWDYLSYDSCYGDVEPYLEGVCQSMSADPYSYYFALETCDDLGGDPQGQFYCSYVSNECQ